MFQCVDSFISFALVFHLPGFNDFINVFREVVESFPVLLASFFEERFFVMDW